MQTSFSQIVQSGQECKINKIQSGFSEGPEHEYMLHMMLILHLQYCNVSMWLSDPDWAIFEEVERHNALGLPLSFFGSCGT